MAMGGNHFIQSGVKGAGLSAMGFFAAGVFKFGAAATVGTLGTAAAVGFAGGLALYAPAVGLRLAMHYFGWFNDQHRLLVFAVDLSLLALTLPVGAWCLGLAMQPFFVAAAVAVTLYLLANVVHYALSIAKEKRAPSLIAGGNQSIASKTLLSEIPINESTASFSLGAFC